MLVVRCSMGRGSDNNIELQSMTKITITKEILSMTKLLKFIHTCKIKKQTKILRDLKVLIEIYADDFAGGSVAKTTLPM